jgi:hypothetical protein
VSKQWGITQLPLAALASAASVFIVVNAFLLLLVVASLFDGLDGLDSHGALGLMILAVQMVRTLAGFVGWFAGLSFVLFPAAALLTRDRPWLRSAVLPMIGAAVGAVIASVHSDATATFLSATAGLISGLAFAFVMRDGPE